MGCPGRRNNGTLVISVCAGGIELEVAMASRDDPSLNASPAGGPGPEASSSGPVPTHPPQPKGIWAKIGLGFGAATLVAIAAPRITTEGSTPPMSPLLMSGLLIALVTSAALYLGIRSDMRLSSRVALYAVGYNVLLVAVKFVFAPRGLYEVNREVTLEQSLFSQNDTTGALLTSGLVFLLYLCVYYVVYRIYRSRVEILRRVRDPAQRKRRLRRLILPMVAGGFLFTVSGGILVVAIIAASGVEYIQFVFSSGYSLLIAVALGGATYLAAVAFKEVAEREAIIDRAVVFVTFFWLGLYFIALYHVLWVVYILVLTAIWPLRVVVPK
jgi:hypothetical protein